MSNARNLANLLGTGTQITTADIADGAFQANKNLIINGAMVIDQRNALKEVIKAGASDFILKPFESDRVLTSIEDCLQKKIKKQSNI